MSYDGIVRLASAAAVATPVVEREEFQQALDAIIRLACDALLMDRLSSVLSTDGAGAVVSACLDLRRMQREPFDLPQTSIDVQLRSQTLVLG